MIAVAIVVLLFIALGMAGVRWGADTREARDWEQVETTALEGRVGAVGR